MRATPHLLALVALVSLTAFAPSGCKQASSEGGHTHGHDHAHEHGSTHAHGHGSPHGGVVQAAPGGHVEVKLERDGAVTVWLLDVNERAATAQGARGSVRLAAAGAQDVPLAYDSARDALTARVSPPGESPVLLVDVTRASGERATLRHAVSFGAAPSAGGGH